MFNLWDIGNFFVTTATIFANLDQEELSNAETMFSWRFLADNSLQTVLPAFETASGLYDDLNQATTRDSNVLQGVILGIKALVTLALALFILRPAIHAVLLAKRNLHDIVERIPKRVVHFFHKRFRAVSKIYSAMENADDETKEN